jgi:hypothetical protein
MQGLNESVSANSCFQDSTARGRRQFLKQVCSGTAAAIASQGVFSELTLAQNSETAVSSLPTVQLGPYRVTRLIAGGNPIGGFSHATKNLTRHMLEYFTLERTIEFLEKCDREGINTWQFDHDPKVVSALRTVRERGSKLQFMCLHSEKKGPIKMAIAETSAIAMVHHGGVTDSLFRAGKAQEVHDFVKRVHDQGILAGVSSHCPENIRRIFDEGWENDLFMTCLYYVTRPREEQQKLLGKVTVGEPFFESDPIEMTKVVRNVSKPCLAFKILAAGRLCEDQKTVEEAFKFAFANIKPTDAVIVGMFPRYEDEVRLNAGYAQRYAHIA